MRLKTVISSIIIIALLTGCAAPGNSEQTTYIQAMDTIMSFSWYGDESLSAGISDIIKDFESKISVTDEASEIYALNGGEAKPLSSETLDIINRSLSMCEKTDGALDITVQPLISLWGFGTESAHKPADADIADALKHVDYHSVSFDSNGQLFLPGGYSLTLGATAKGYVTDKVTEYLRANNVTSALLSLGGNVAVIGYKPNGSMWTIAITDPFSPSTFLGSVKVSDKSVVTSGAYNRYFEENGKTYHHILDPKTGYPADNDLSSVTIIGDSSFLCDSLSTALFVMGSEKAIEYWNANQDFDMILVTKDKDIFITPGIEKTFAPESRFKVTKVLKAD